MGPPPPPGPPAPPPPPPPPSLSESGAVEDSAGALFAEITALGADGIRGTLKKGTRGPVNDEAPAPAHETVPSQKKKPVELGGEPKCALQGKKWCIEYQNGATGDKAVNIDANLRQTVYVFKCHDSLVKVNGKINAIVLDSCTKTACVFDEALAAVEIVNCKDIQIQCTTTAPALSIDGCTAVTYYMSSSFESAQIVTAKSAAVNLIRPADDDDIVETPIPEQFWATSTIVFYTMLFLTLKCVVTFAPDIAGDLTGHVNSTTWKDGAWVTECVDHSD